MKTLKIGLVTLVLLGTSCFAFWIFFKPSQTSTNRVEFICESSKFEDFASSLNDSEAYYVKNEQTIETAYQNTTAMLTYNKNLTSALLVLSCATPLGVTCDVYRFWKDQFGCLRVVRNFKKGDDVNRSLEYFVHFNKSSNDFHILNNETGFETRFGLVSAADSTETSSAKCLPQIEDDVIESVQHCMKNYIFDFDMLFCKLRISTMVVGKYDVRSKSVGSLKRLLLIPIFLAGTIGFIWILVKLTNLINSISKN